MSPGLRWTLRGLATLALVALSVVTVRSVAGLWQDESEFHRTGARADVLVVQLRNVPEKDPQLKVSLPDGTTAWLDDDVHAKLGDRIPVVYDPDDPSYVEYDEWPTDNVLFGVLFAAGVVAVSGACIYRMLVRPFRYRPMLPPPSSTPPPSRRTSELEARARRARRTARQSRTVNRR